MAGVVVWWFVWREEPAVAAFRWGRDLQARGDTAAAMAQYDRALAADPSRQEPHYFLGQLLLEQQRVAEAIPHLDAAVSAGIRPDAAPFDLARALASRNDYGAARRALARLQIPSEADTNSIVVAGDMAERLQDPALAVRFYQQAAVRPDVPLRIVERLGVLLGTIGRPSEAVEVLEAAIAKQPADASLHLNLAVALAQAGRMQDARTHVGEALRLKPDYEQAKALSERLGR